MKPALAALGERGALAADAVVGLPAPYPGPYMDVWLGLIRARALITAVRIGVFDALPGSTEELAARCDCDAERLEVLLAALHALRYVRPGWRATRRGRAYFGPKAALRLDATVGALSAANWDQLSGLDDVLRGADPPGLHDGAADADTFAGYQAAMTELITLSAPVVLKRLGRPRRLLDVGGGPGTFAAQACARWPGLEVTIADFPDAAALGRERIAGAGLADRVTYVEGDARTSALGTGHDAATLINVLHNVDRDTGVGLLAAAGRAAERVVVCEIEGTRTQVGTLASLTFLSWMGSRAWTGEQLAAMARDAGLRNIRLHRPVRLAGGVLVTADS
jgi:hypothetical protein